MFSRHAERCIKAAGAQRRFHRYDLLLSLRYSRACDGCGYVRHPAGTERGSQVPVVLMGITAGQFRQDRCYPWAVSNIRKVRNTMLGKIRKKLLAALTEKVQAQQPLTLLEKEFLSENGIDIESSSKT